MQRSFLMILVVLLFSSGCLRAETLTVSESGVFSADTPTTLFSAPSASFAYSFQIASNPQVSEVRDGYSFLATISDFRYTLDGQTSAPHVLSVQIYNEPYGDGLFTLCLDIPCSGASVFPPGLGFELTGDQIYSGSEAAPVILPGSYKPYFDSPFFSDPSGTYPVANASNVVIGPAITPEPSSLLLLGTGLVTLTATARRKTRCL